MLIIGHRGARGLAPENTLASFKAALEAGVDGVEFDVRSTKDSKLVILHDSKLLGLVVKATSFAELKKAHPDLLLFEDLMEFLLGKTSAYIEVKPGIDTEIFISALKHLLESGWSAEDIFVLSFSQEILRTVHKAMPSVKLMINEPWSSVKARKRAKELGTHYIDMNYNSLWSGFVKLMAKNQYLLSCYPLNSPKKAARLQKAGLSMVITDFPDRFKDFRTNS